MAKALSNEVAKYQLLGKQAAEVLMKFKCQNSFKTQPNSQNMIKVSNKKHQKKVLP